MAKNLKKDILSGSLAKLIKEGSCFDLQFRRDVRYERRNHPTYYRWKAQFIIISNKNDKKSIVKIKNILSCGKIYSTENQIRYAVQGIDNLYNVIIPFLRNKKLLEEKEKGLNLWAKAVNIIYRHKGKSLATWSKKDFQDLLKIYKLTQKGKNKSSHKRKWTLMAESIVKTL
jgi:hypothetical protein